MGFCCWVFGQTFFVFAIGFDAINFGIAIAGGDKDQIFSIGRPGGICCPGSMAGELFFFTAFQI